MIDNKKMVTALLLAIIAILLGVIIFGSQRETGISLIASSPDAVNLEAKAAIFFYGNACPHCKEVEKWMQQHQVEEKTAIVKKEVYDNRGNGQALFQAAKNCGMGAADIKVPLLYTPDGKCIVGAPQVIGYLAAAAGLSLDGKAVEDSSATSTREQGIIEEKETGR